MSDTDHRYTTTLPSSAPEEDWPEISKVITSDHYYWSDTIKRWVWWDQAAQRWRFTR